MMILPSGWIAMAFGEPPGESRPHPPTPKVASGVPSTLKRPTIMALFGQKSVEP
jgi:hypothetical protein